MALTAIALFSPANGRQAIPGKIDRARAWPAMLKPAPSMILVSTVT